MINEYEDIALFDSHTHLNNEDLTEGDVKGLIEAIEASQVEYVMNVGFDLPSSELALNQAEGLSWCYAAVGCHPHDAATMDEEKIKVFEKLAAHEKAKAIGEIGLDFHYDISPRDVQEHWFRRQIQLANRLRMPIVIHSRDADQLCMDILVSEGAFSDERKGWFPKRPSAAGGEEGDARVLLHCFSGSSELAKEYVRLGGTISMAGPVTYKNAKKNVRVVEELPMEYLLVETDAPYLTPVPHRGERNMSPYVIHTAEKVAEIKGLTLKEVADATRENAKRFFNIR